MKLILDEMLVHTARLLRIFGVDAATIKPKNDDELVRYAAKENRILITKDVGLVDNARRHGVKTLFLHSDNIEEQLLEIKQDLGVAFEFPGKTRCSMCNGELLVVDKEQIKTMIPENVYQNHDKFWLCQNCKKAYWEGNHWTNIRKIYERISS